MVKSLSGVRAKERLNKKTGKMDVYFSIRYKRNGKQFEEGIGWKSDGYTTKKVFDELQILRQDIKAGRALSLKDKRERLETAQKAYEKANITFSELFEEYYQPHIENKDKKSTYNREVHLYKKWLKPVLGGLRLDRISRISLISLLQPMDKKRLTELSSCKKNKT